VDGPGADVQPQEGGDDCGGIPGAGWAMVKLMADQQQDFVRAEPEVFVALKGGWARRGAANVRLQAAKKATVRKALEAA
jgi:hypothetical protein